jgi:hypothetical protein
MIFARRTPHTPATLVSPTDGLDMKVSTRQKQGATRHKGAGAKGDNSASWVSGSPRTPPSLASGLLTVRRIGPLPVIANEVSRFFFPVP